jgi:hypothetical protein
MPGHGQGRGIALPIADGIHLLDIGFHASELSQPTCHKVQGYPQPSLLHDIA